MSKTINPASYVIIHEWVYELLCREEEFSISDVVDHVPMSEYEYEDNFNELYSTMVQYTVDEIYGISEKQGFDTNLCIDLNKPEEEQNVKYDDYEVCSDAEGRLNIPKKLVKQLEGDINNPTLGIFGNEVIICDIKNKELNEAKSIVFCDVIKYWEDSPYIRMNFEKYFEDEPTNKHYNIWYDVDEKILHILH